MANPTSNSGVYTPDPDDYYDDPGPLVEFDSDLTHPANADIVEPDDLIEGFIPNAAGSTGFETEALDLSGRHMRRQFGLDADDTLTTSPMSHMPPRSPRSPMSPMDQFEIPELSHGASTQHPEVKLAPEMTPKERAAAVNRILAEDAERNPHVDTLVAEVGPLGEIEKTLQALTRNTVDGEVATVVMSHIRQSLNDAVAVTPKLSSPGNAEPGLRARIDALQLFQQNFKNRMESLSARFSDVGINEVAALKEATQHVIKQELADLTRQTEKLVPQNIGHVLFDALSRQFRPPSTQIVGNAREHRNAQLREAMAEAKTIAHELKDNAGNVAWEKLQGKACVDAFDKCSKHIQGLTRGVEDQIDPLVLRRGMQESQSALEAARTTSVDDDHKSRLQQSQEFFAAMMKSLLEAFSKVFGNKSSARTPGP